MTPISASTGGRPRLPGNNNYKVLEYSAKNVGCKEVHTGNMSINSLEYDERPACRQIGCLSGCAIGAKKRRSARSQACAVRRRQKDRSSLTGC